MASCAQSSWGRGAEAAANIALSSAAEPAPTMMRFASGRPRAKARAACNGSAPASAIHRRALDKRGPASASPAGRPYRGVNKSPCWKIERNWTSTPRSASRARSPFATSLWSSTLTGTCTMSGRNRLTSATGESSTFIETPTCSKRPSSCNPRSRRQRLGPSGPRRSSPEPTTTACPRERPSFLNDARAAASTAITPPALVIERTITRNECVRGA